jgi:perosamine synthetase
VNLENNERINGAWATTVVFSRDSGVTTQQAIDHLARKGIPLRPFFYPLSSLPAYQGNTSGGPERNPVAYDLASRGVHLPCALNLTDAQVERVAEALNELIGEASA